MGYVTHYQSSINIQGRASAVGRITPNSLIDAKNTQSKCAAHTCLHYHPPTHPHNLLPVRLLRKVRVYKWTPLRQDVRLEMPLAHCQFLKRNVATAGSFSVITRALQDSNHVPGKPQQSHPSGGRRAGVHPDTLFGGHFWR